MLKVNTLILTIRLPTIAGTDLHNNGFNSDLLGSYCLFALYDTFHQNPYCLFNSFVSLNDTTMFKTSLKEGEMRTCLPENLAWVSLGGEVEDGVGGGTNNS